MGLSERPSYLGESSQITAEAGPLLSRSARVFVIIERREVKSFGRGVREEKHGVILITFFPERMRAEVSGRRGNNMSSSCQCEVAETAGGVKRKGFFFLAEESDEIRKK